MQLALSECNYFSLHLGSDREAREREVIEIALGSQTFIKKVYEMNIKRVSAKIMLRKVQKKWKKKRREKQNKLVRGIFKGFGEMKLSRKVSASGLLTK